MINTVDSDYFGMTFYFDDNNDLMYAPSLIAGGYDKDCEGYVSEWDDWEGVDMDKLFNIHKFCIINKLNYAGSLTHREVNHV